MKKQSKEINKYAAKMTTWGILGTAFIAVCAMYLGMSLGSGEFNGAGILIFLILAVVFLLIDKKTNPFNAQLAALEKDQAQFAALSADFTNGAKYLNDGIRIGNVFALGKMSGNIVRISDITAVTRNAKKNTLDAVVNGKAVLLCSLKVKAKNISVDEEVRRIIAALQQINPNIAAG